MLEQKKTSGTKKDIVMNLAMQGLSNSQIAERTGIKYGTVWAILKDFRKLQKECAGKNADRHLCKTCQHRLTKQLSVDLRGKCNYIGSTEGKKRPCNVEDCYVYVKGDPIREKEE